MHKNLKTAAAAVVLAAFPFAASAHPGLHAAGFEDGFIHPFTGADHLLAMIATGYWAGQLSGRARFVIPAVFVGLMMVGAALGFHSEAPGFIEYGIAASVAALGLLLAFDVKMPPVPAAGLVGLFAFCHGFAHGAEAPATATQALFFGGFVLASLILQGAGFGLSLLRPGKILSRIAGAFITLSGAWMLGNA
ncbi:HupE/UreJ family protein [Rhodoblastus sp. 17X3]|uniref:HupE/UreJ family protein n=1 Tax=Rhodoblastus sp. 17X3 TaxID=3047026 RepID=UPI0024B87557|nr:HupE/UreJ family protein [Rhodoblastus sp. 17X3]MDI9850204.1 HupE/UreJ family protein [Rhodoblastus sp. 17X3]